MRMSDWSSYVCSSDLIGCRSMPFVGTHHKVYPIAHVCLHQDHGRFAFGGLGFGQFQSANHIVHVVSVHLLHIPSESRSEERRVGQEWVSTCGSRGWPTQ